jgi:hypothetical protein
LRRAVVQDLLILKIYFFKPRLEKSMHQSKETNWRYSGGKERKRSRIIDDWGALDDIFNQRHQKIRKRARRQSSAGIQREPD